MNFNLVHPETWAGLNHKIHNLWSLPPEISVRVYKGMHHAAYELAVGTALFLSHKRSVASIQGQTPAFQTVMPFLYKEAFQLQLQSQLQPKAALLEWAKALKADNSFVMQAEDNPITGECFFDSELETVFHDKKIFSIRASHGRHFHLRSFAERGLTPSSIQICELNSELAVALCGSRFKSPVQISSHLHWDTERVLSDIKNMASSTPEQATQELKLPPGFQALKTQEPRFADRVLFFNNEIHGEALEIELKKRLSLNKDSSLISSLNSCRHGFLDLTWWENRPQPESLRGLVIVDQKLLSQKNLEPLLLESAQACRI